MSNQSGFDAVNDLVKALEAGGVDAAPSTLTQGSALQIEDLSPVMNLITFDNTHIKLQNKMSVVSCKSTLAQFDRQLSYGDFGNAAQIEGQVGQENTSDYVRVTVPMCYYSSIRRNTLASTMVATVDGKKSDERAAQDAAIQMSGEVEFDIMRGQDSFSNAGVFDANPFAIPPLPQMHGLAMQVRQSDFQTNARDINFAEYGNDDSVTLSAGGVLTQNTVEDAALRSSLNFGTANRLLVDPVVLSNYNKIVFGKERIILAGSPQDATGGDLTRQWVSGGTVKIEGSQFLRGKAKPARQRSDGPAAPTNLTTTNAAAGTTLVAGVYIYYATSRNERGESNPSVTATATSATGDKNTLTITHPSGTVRYFNMYRSPAGGSAAQAKYIGSVAIAGGGATTTAFVDLNNRLPGFVTGLLVQEDTMELRELSPYSRLKLAVTDLSTPEAHFRFVCEAVMVPRKNVVVDNLAGSTP